MSIHPILVGSRHHRKQAESRKNYILQKGEQMEVYPYT